ncbi:hypothetical protein M406DRAFT_52389 [Cryphonectria parasitica EP155]|uniref:DNA repair metallo-beta-lactamase domain-containing protein n=1 Tax=Cryphonectria parasitica (strain ATCC 38755 / EP155) TaxID=660469 RepID=A0A9P4YAY0_CRYP1|nr:uncharacterized protein M406DRAFT_52389 [Cryphonectria parasitica EP155]KAF3769305.1 hypothetical protein M406DRAFT_52389 [Cryphonectria parasitica EP155]
MAPAKTSRASKPARPAPRPALSKTPKKRDSVTNKSILSFFHKVDRPEESMFIDGDTPSVVQQPRSNEDDDDDIYGANDPALEERYNEAQVPSKRRKLSDASDGFNNSLEPLPSERQVKPQLEETPRSKPPLPKKKPFKGPFLDDSSDSEEEEEDHETMPNIRSSQAVWKTTTNTTTPTTSAHEEPSGPDLTPAPAPEDPACETLPPPLKHEMSTNGDYGEFDDLDDELDDDSFEGEELREMRFMKAQARLEAEEAGVDSCDDGFETLMEDDGMTESCPICSASLVGITPDEATVHVNSCLDGNPTPLPSKKPLGSPPQSQKPRSKPEIKQEDEVLVSMPEVGKRFARAAVARPGQANPISIGEGGPGAGSGSASAFSKLMSGHAEDAAWATAAAAENASRGKPAYQRTCPFYKIMPGFHICVDAFRYGAVKGCRAYFLSHFHSDHYIGLTANWTHGPIYCSRVTGSLVKSQLKTAEKYVVELEFEEKVPVPGTDGVSVTMIPANHCPGSSLFLFEKSVLSPNAHANSKEKNRVQRILHCGDFRACPAHIEHPQLKPETVDALGKMKQQKIDVCYLDTTYLNPRYSFPPQTDVIRACAQLCLELDSTLREENETDWHNVLPTATTPPNALSVLGQQARANRNRLLVVCGTYSIGKERICKVIALALKTKIFASPAKIRICSQLGDPELTSLMTNNPHEAQVHMQMLMEIRAETLAEYLDHYRPHFGRVIGFRPSGWNYRPSLANNGGRSGSAAQVTANTPPTSVPTTQILHGPAWRTRFGPRDLVPQQGSSREAMCFGVPYSEHSSFRELMLFVMALRIEKIVPTVNVGSEPSRRRMKGWTDRWLSERRRGGVLRIVMEGGDGGEGEDDKNKVAMWDGKDGRGGAVHW